MFFYSKCSKFTQQAFTWNFGVQFTHLMQHQMESVFLVLLLKNFDLVSNWVANPLYDISFHCLIDGVFCGMSLCDFRIEIELHYNCGSKRIFVKRKTDQLKSITLVKFPLVHKNYLNYLTSCGTELGGDSVKRFQLLYPGTFNIE